MESFYWKNSRKTSTESAAITEALCQMCHTKWESTEWTSSERFFYFPCQNLFKEALRTRLSGNKITWTETFVRSKKFAKWKTTLNRGTLACYENFPIKTHLKKKNMQSFLCDTVTLLPPDSVASGVYTAFPQITQKILITNTCHWLEPITVILGFLKNSLLEQQSLISELWFFLKVQGSNFQVQFCMDYVFPLMPIISSCENSSCV